MMETLFRLLTLIVTNLILNLILFDFFENKYERKFKKKHRSILISIFVIIAVAITIYANFLYNLIIYTMIFIVLNTLLFRLRKKRDIIVNVTFFLLLVLWESIAHIFIGYMVNTLDISSTNIFVDDVRLILSSLVQFILYMTCKNYLFKTSINYLARKDMISYFIISIMSILVTIMAVLFTDNVNSDVQIFFFVLVVGLAIFNIYYIQIILSISQKYEMQQKLNVLELNHQLILDHYHSVQENAKENSVIIHDIKNHLQVLKTSIDQNENNVSEREYLKMIEAKVGSLSPVIYSKRKILNILFCEKLREAKKYDIQIEYHIQKDIEFSFISDFDLITIFANLLDNAIDASKEIAKEHRKINLHIRKIKKFIVIKETNFCNNEIMKKDNVIVSSKPGHSGLGLYSMQKTLDKYEANMLVEIDEAHQFSNTILISL